MSSPASAAFAPSPGAPPLWRRPSVLALLAGNIVPLIGVLFLGWDLRNILLLYWAESAVIGFYTVLKMLIAKPLAAIFISAFFCFHYGMFMAGHLFFLLVLTSEGLSGSHTRESLSTAAINAVTPGMVAALLALFISHGISFATHFIAKRQYLAADVNKLMTTPYPRIIVMHITLIGGAFLTVALGQPIALLLLLVILKTAVDLTSHLREHRPK